MLTQLKEAAEQLNAASDEFTKQIRLIDEKLKSLNLGVAAWVGVQATRKEAYDIGYTKLNGHWGISFQAHKLKPHEVTDQWAFNDAPRWLRIVVDFIQTLEGTEL